MKPRQRHILRMLSSIAVGIMAFSVTLFVVALLGAIVLSLLVPVPVQSGAFFYPELAVLFLISTLMALAVAVFVGVKYYRYVGKDSTSKIIEQKPFSNPQAQD